MKESHEFSFYTNNIFNFQSRIQKKDKDNLVLLSEKNKYFSNFRFMHLISHIPALMIVKKVYMWAKKHLKLSKSLIKN